MINLSIFRLLSHTPSKMKQVLHPRSLNSTARLPPQNRWGRAAPESARLDEKPRVAPFPPRGRFRECGSKSDAGVGEDWGVGAG